MRAAPRCRAILAALLAVSASAAAWAADGSQAAPTSLIYGLTGSGLPEQSLLEARWGTPGTSLRFDTAAGVGAHELRLLSYGSLLPATPLLSSFADEAGADWNVDPVRATYRYTLLDRPTWAMKLGLSTNLGESPGALRAAPATARTSFGSLPLLHLAGVAQWSPRWRLGFAFDGLATLGGRARDLGVEVDYRWSKSMSVFGGYQLTEAAGEAEGYYGSGLNNRANIGLRYRF
jgi:opacity protein-like surface antigen